MREIGKHLCLLAMLAMVPVAGTHAAETTRASVGTDGTQGEFGNSNMASISSTGRFVVFESSAWYLAGGDNGQQHVYLRDRMVPLTERISVSTAGVVGNNGSLHGTVSADGRFVAFSSQATNLVSPPTTFGRAHVYLRDRQNGTTILVSAAPNGAQGSAHSSWPAITPDGRYIAFESLATNLTDPPANGQRHILRYDRMTGAIVQASLHDDGSQATSSCFHPSISDDGDRIVFHTFAVLDPRYAWIGNQNVYVRKITAPSRTDLMSAAWNGTDSGNLHSYDPVISGDGWKVAFHSDASNLINDTWNGNTHVYVRDRHGAGSTLRASVTSVGAQGNGTSLHASLNGDGTLVAFESVATNLVPGDGNGWSDIFVHVENPAATHRVSVPDDALGDLEANAWSWYPAISADGRFAAFESWATDLVASDTNGFADIFVRDIGAIAASVPPVLGNDGVTRLLTVRPNPLRAGEEADLHYGLPAPAGGSLELYDVNGRPVRVLRRGVLEAGPRRERWDGRDESGEPVKSGVYFLRLKTDRGAHTRKLVVTR